eukprot:gene9205-16345_t
MRDLNAPLHVQAAQLKKTMQKRENRRDAERVQRATEREDGSLDSVYGDKGNLAGMTKGSGGVSSAVAALSAISGAIHEVQVFKYNDVAAAALQAAAWSGSQGTEPTATTSSVPKEVDPSHRGITSYGNGRMPNRPPPPASRPKDESQPSLLKKMKLEQAKAAPPPPIRNTHQQMVADAMAEEEPLTIGAPVTDAEAPGTSSGPGARGGAHEQGLSGAAPSKLGGGGLEGSKQETEEGDAGGAAEPQAGLVTYESDGEGDGSEETSDDDGDSRDNAQKYPVAYPHSIENRENNLE